MIVMLPSLSTMVAALGLTGLGAMGARWLADRRFMQGTQRGTVLIRVATTVANGTRQVMAVCAEIATTAVRAARSVVRGAEEVARGLFGWVSGWFAWPRYA